jgi:hypothetical protein
MEDDRMTGEHSEPVAVIDLPARNGDLELSVVNDVSKGLWTIWPADRHAIEMNPRADGGVQFQIYEASDNGPS